MYVMVDLPTSLFFSGMFCLTERDRGPNLCNVGTCAIMHPDGSFELWTPYDGAAKWVI